MEKTTTLRGGLSGWATRDILVLAVMSIAIGLVLVPMIYIEQLLIGALGPYSLPATMSPYCILALLPMAIIRRPGTSIVAGLISGLVWLPFTGSVMGLISGLLIGVLCEIPFLTTRYRRFGTLFFMGTAAFAALAMTAMFYTMMGLLALSLLTQISVIVVTLVASALIGGYISVLLASALLRTGVLSHYASVQERSSI